MTTEEIKSIKQNLKDFPLGGWRDKAIATLLTELQAEKDRADKAEEMVAALRELCIKTHKYMVNHQILAEFSKTELPDDCKEVTRNLLLAVMDKGTEQTAQAHNKRKCDEICWKIETHPLKYEHWGMMEAAIDIVKSVLGGSND